MKLEFPRPILEEKYADIKFHVKPSSGSQAVARRRTDGQADSQTLRSQESFLAISRKKAPSNAFRNVTDRNMEELLCKVFMLMCSENMSSKYSLRNV
jgi:hypothetical protein